MQKRRVRRRRPRSCEASAIGSPPLSSTPSQTASPLKQQTAKLRRHLTRKQPGCAVNETANSQDAPSLKLQTDRSEVKGQGNRPVLTPAENPRRAHLQPLKAIHPSLNQTPSQSIRERKRHDASLFGGESDTIPVRSKVKATAAQAIQTCWGPLRMRFQR